MGPRRGSGGSLSRVAWTLCKAGYDSPVITVKHRPQAPGRAIESECEGVHSAPMNEFERTQILGRGYPAQAAPSARARLVPVNPAAGAAVIDLSAEVVELARSGSDMLLPWSEGMPAAELRLFRQDGAWGVAAIGKRSRVLVNHSPVTLSFLKPGDNIGFGPAVYRFETDGPAPAAPGAVPPDTGAKPPTPAVAPPGRIGRWRRGPIVAGLIIALLVASMVVLALI